MLGSERRSTLYLRGSAALTLSEMQAFVKEVETRPRARLLADLPQLLILSDSKFHMVERVLVRRILGLEPDARGPFIAALRVEAAQSPELVARERAGRLLAALGPHPAAS